MSELFHCASLPHAVVSYEIFARTSQCEEVDNILSFSKFLAFVIYSFLLHMIPVGGLCVVHTLLHMTKL